MVSAAVRLDCLPDKPEDPKEAWLLWGRELNVFTRPEPSSSMIDRNKTERYFWSSCVFARYSANLRSKQE